MNYTHVEKVRLLYKVILRLHRSLPKDLQLIGTNYVRDEFKRHKKCSKAEANVFMNEWTNYAISLSNQLKIKGPEANADKRQLGLSLSESDLDKLRAEQLYQLYELMEATKSPGAENHADR